jgi:hypothetical protein
MQPSCLPLRVSAHHKQRCFLAVCLSVSLYNSFFLFSLVSAPNFVVFGRNLGVLLALLVWRLALIFGSLDQEPLGENRALK